MSTWEELYNTEECYANDSIFLVKDFSNKNNLMYCDGCGQIYSIEDVDKDLRSMINGNYCKECVEKYVH